MVKKTESSSYGHRVETAYVPEQQGGCSFSLGTSAHKVS